MGHNNYESQRPKNVLILETEHFTVTDPVLKKESFQISLEFTGQGELTASCNEATQGTEVAVAIKSKTGFRLEIAAFRMCSPVMVF